MAAGSADAAARLAAAHRAFVADDSVQFSLRRPDPPPQMPHWLKSIGDWVEWALSPLGRLLVWIARHMPSAPYARIILWSVLAIAAAALLWLIWMRIREGDWRLPRWRRRSVAAPADPEVEHWAPDAAPARAWLEEADALAAQGRYAEAAHHLLMRSVEDIARRRPGLVRPSLTSREIARASALPAQARALFAGIAAVVERALFGGRAVAAEEWAECRGAYADFVRSVSWRARA